MPARAVSSGPVVHNAYCDVCRKTIVGSRHKCLDCPDYDMCDACISANRAKHPAEHQFFELKEPGRVVVHNVDRPFPQPTQPAQPTDTRRPRHGPPREEDAGADLHRRHTWHRGPDHMRHPPTFPWAGPVPPPQFDPFFGPFVHPPPPPPPPPPPMPFGGPMPLHPPVPPVVPPPPVFHTHNANCDLCDNKIRGNRYKCTTCPDYDVCEMCYAIIPEQHPRHGFIRIKDPRDVMIRPHHFTNRVTHHARCDGCGKQIVGARFKCLHKSCPDFDLCENCEALPIDAHPSSHPLVKLKLPISSYEGLMDVFKAATGQAQPARAMPIVIRPVPVEEPKPATTCSRASLLDELRATVAARKTPTVTTPQSEMIEVRGGSVTMSPAPQSPLPVEKPATPANEEEMPAIPTVIPSPVVPTGPLVDLTEALTLNSPAPVHEEEIPSAVVIPSVESPFADEQAVKEDIVAPTPVSPSASRPSATFVADNTIEDGTSIPAGGVFVKSWRMKNDGRVAWSERTTLVWTGGDRMGTSPSDVIIVAGGVLPGEQENIQVELRAPLVAGRYSSYWRLQDDQGRPFGHRLWCDIQVVEPQTVNSGESSLSSSSLVIMPVPPSVEATPAPVPVVPATPTISTLPSEVDPEEFTSAHSSDIEDVRSESDVSELWEDTGRPGSPDQFVMVYESSNDSDEN